MKRNEAGVTTLKVITKGDSLSISKDGFVVVTFISVELSSLSVDETTGGGVTLENLGLGNLNLVVVVVNAVVVRLMVEVVIVLI